MMEMALVNILLFGQKVNRKLQIMYIVVYRRESGTFE